jgi:hypothetical protein
MQAVFAYPFHHQDVIGDGQEELGGCWSAKEGSEDSGPFWREAGIYGFIFVAGCGRAKWMVWRSMAVV